MSDRLDVGLYLDMKVAQAGTIVAN